MHGSFTERMDLGKTLAQDQRNKGKATCRQRGGKIRTAADRYRSYSELDKLELFFKQWRHEWQYAGLAAVEWALFGEDYEEYLKAEGWR